MPQNPPPPPPTSAQAVTKFVARHVEAVALVTGFFIGALTAIVAGVLT